MYWKKLRLFVAVVGASIFAGFASFAQDEVAQDTVGIFDKVFASKITNEMPNPRLRVRNGREVFCIQERAAVSESVGKLISNLSSAFELSWKQDYVDDLMDCSDMTTFFVLHEERLDQEKILNLMEEVVGSAPPDPDRLFPTTELGFTVSLPGPGHRAFIFLSSRDGMQGWNVRSIMSEEILHAVIRASDFSTTQIVSLLGENAASDNYSLWFEHNPKGFCVVDIILMELVLGSTTQNLKRMHSMREHLVTQFDELLEAARQRGSLLASYTDPRCSN